MAVTFALPITALSEREQEAPLVFDRRRQSCDLYRCTGCGQHTITTPDLADWRCAACGTAARAVLIARVRNDPPKENARAETT